MKKTYYMYTAATRQQYQAVVRNVDALHNQQPLTVRAVSDMQQDGSWRHFIGYLLPQIYQPVACVTDDQVVIYQNTQTRIHDRASLQAQLAQAKQLFADAQGTDGRTRLQDALKHAKDVRVAPSPHLVPPDSRSAVLQVQSTMPFMGMQEFVMTSDDTYHYVTKTVWPRLQRLALNWPRDINVVTALTRQLIPSFRSPLVITADNARPLVFALSADSLDETLATLTQRTARIEQWVRGYRVVDGVDVFKRIVTSGAYDGQTVPTGTPLPPSMVNIPRYCVLTTMELQDDHGQITTQPLAVDVVPMLMMPVISKTHKLLNVLQFSEHDGNVGVKEVQLAPDEAAITIYPVAANGALAGLGTKRPTTVTGSYRFKNIDNPRDKR